METQDYAVIKTSGSQCVARVGEIITVDRRPEEVGSKIEFSDVVLANKAGAVTVGTPTVQGAKVIGEIANHVRGDKVISFKKKRRQGFKKTIGHRQELSEVRITDLKL